MRRRVAITAVTVAFAVIGTSGLAMAYWPRTGSGTGHGATGTTALSATTVTVAGLYPGATVAATVTIKNTSAGPPISVTALAQSGTATVQAAGKGSCTPSVVTFAAGTLPGTPLTPGQSVGVPGSISMSASAPDGCQGTTFNIPLTATGRTS